MVNPNTGSLGGESQEELKTKKSEKGNIFSLLKGGISRALGDPIDPVRFNQFQTNTGNLEEEVRQHMKDIKSARGIEWEGVDEKDIQELKKHQIHEQVLYASSGLVARRKKAIDRIAEVYPDIKNESSWESRLMKHIGDLDESELLQFATKKSLMKKALLSVFPESTNITPRGGYNFEEIFHDIDTTNATEKEKKELRQIHRYYEQHGSYPDSLDIEKILSLYRGKSASRKLEILGGFDGELDIRFASENNLIDRNYLEKFAEKNFGELYTRLGESEKKTFINNLAWNEDISITARDMKAGDFDAVFSDPKKLRKIGESIVRKLGIVINSERDTTSLSIPAKMKSLESEDTDDTKDQDPIEVFKRLITKDLRSPDNTKCLVNQIESLKTGSIIMFGDEEEPRYFRVKQSLDEQGLPLDADNGGESGILIEGLPIQDGMIQEKQARLLTYTELYEFFRNSTSDVKILTKEEFDARLTTDSKEAGIDGKIYDASEVLSEEVTEMNIASKLDALDTAGRGYGFHAGTYFSAPEEEKEGKAETKIWKVLKVHGSLVDIISPRGTREDNISLDMIVGLARAGKLKRTSQISDDDSFIQALSAEYGVSDHAHIDGNQLIEEHEDHGKKVKHAVKCFSGKDGHIRIGGIEDGMVYFGEYRGEDTSKAQEYAGKFGAEKAQKAFYQPQTMTYGAFLDYLKSEKLKASPDDILNPHAHHEDHDGHHHPHTHGSIISRIGRMQTLGSMWKGAEMIWHSVEHTLEKGSKLDAARFAMKASKFMPFLGDGVQAQLYADIVDESKSITEKYKNKIGNLMGPAQRLKCLHIVQNTDSRPEEVMAAIQFMVSSYGHLYAEDIREHQSIVTRPRLEKSPYGTYAFLDAFIRSTGMPGGDGKPPHIYWRLKAYDKAIPEMGDKEGHEGEPTEEQLLHALFKSIDGKPDEFPYAGSVVKAIGGPGGFEKDWKFEGFENAYEKGKKQTTMVNAQGRLNKAIGYLSTHEIFKAMGGMEQVAGKTKDPKMQAFPFVWAIGGYTKYASPTALQKLKNYAENGFSFHAYAFLREESDNTLYRDTVRLALKELVKQGKMRQGDLDSFDSICKRMDNGPESADDTDKKYGKETPPVAMMKFWQTHYSNGLNDMLQNKNGWLTVEAKKSPTIRNYREKFSAVHNTQLNDSSIPGTEFGKDWYDEHGYNNLIMGDKGGLKSLDRMLAKIRFDGTAPGGRKMVKDSKEKIWDYIVKYMKEGLRDDTMFLGDEKTQREQYLLHRAEIIQYFAETLTARTIKGREGDRSDEIIRENLKTFPYYQDMIDMGIDPMAVFDEKLVKGNEGTDFQAWRNTELRTSRREKVDDVVSAVLTRANKAQERTRSRKIGPKSAEFRDTDNDPRTMGHSEGIGSTDSD